MGCEICACCLWPPHFLAHDALPFPTPRRAVELVLSLEEHVQRLFLLVLSVNVLGDWLRDRLDPRSRARS